MASLRPRVHIYGTSIMSSSKIRSNHEKVDRIFKAAGIEHVFHDISWDEAAKQVYKRKNGGSTELPLIVSGGIRCGSIEQLEDAVEFRELEQFLRLDQPAQHEGDEDAALLASLSPEEVAALAAELGPAASQLTLQAPAAASTTDSSAHAPKVKAATTNVGASADALKTEEVPLEPAPTPVGEAAAVSNVAVDPEAISEALPEQTATTHPEGEVDASPAHLATSATPEDANIPSSEAAATLDSAPAAPDAEASSPTPDVTLTSASEGVAPQTDVAKSLEMIGVPMDEVALKKQKEAEEGHTGAVV